MRSTTKTIEPPTQAYTDLYDEVEHNFLIRYPGWLVPALSFSGVLAFALAGFIDRQGGIFPASGPLFLWLCAIVITVQMSILRHASLRNQRVATLIVDLIAILVVIIAYFAPTPHGPSVDVFSQIKAAAEQVPTLALINFALILIFAADSIRRWINRAMGKSIVPRIYLGIGAPAPRDEALDEANQPSLLNLISGDLIAGGVFIIVLSFLLTPAISNSILSAIIPHQYLTDCTLAPGGFSPCTKLGAPMGAEPGFFAPNGLTDLGFINDPRLLSLTDLILSLLLLIPGLLILAPAALSSGLGAPVDQAPAPVPASMGTDTASTGSISKEVSKEVLDTLTAGLTRRFRFSFVIALRDLALRFRHVVWPLLILVGIGAASVTAKKTAEYLHVVRAAPECHSLTTFYTCFGSPSYALQDIGYAVVAGAIIIVGILLSSAALVFSWRVASNSFLFLLLVGFILALTLWIFSLILSIINLVYWLFTNNTAPNAFPQPSFILALSLLFFLRYAIPWLISRARARRTGAPVPPMVDIGSITGGRRAQRVEQPDAS